MPNGNLSMLQNVIPNTYYLILLLYHCMWKTLLNNSAFIPFILQFPEEMY